MANQVASENYTIDARLGVDWKVRLSKLKPGQGFSCDFSPRACTVGRQQQSRPAAAASQMRFVKWQE